MSDYLPDTPRLRPEDADTTWMNQGLCQTEDWTGYAHAHRFESVTDMFFPERGAATRPAERVCEQCPVKTQCRDYALEEPALQGIWGGTSHRQRSKMRADSGYEPRGRALSRCGTLAAYRRHLNTGEPVCERCRDARRRYDAQRKPTKRAS